MCFSLWRFDKKTFSPQNVSLSNLQRQSPNPLKPDYSTDNLINDQTYTVILLTIGISYLFNV